MAPLAASLRSRVHSALSFHFDFLDVLGCSFEHVDALTDLLEEEFDVPFVWGRIHALESNQTKIASLTRLGQNPCAGIKSNQNSLPYSFFVLSFDENLLPSLFLLLQPLLASVSPLGLEPGCTAEIQSSPGLFHLVPEALQSSNNGN